MKKIYGYHSIVLQCVCHTGYQWILNSDLGIHFDVIFPTGLTYCFKCANAKMFYFDTSVDVPFMDNNHVKTQLTYIQVFKL